MTHILNYEEIKECARNRTIVWEELRTSDKLRPLCFDGTDFVGLANNNYLLLCECDEEECPDYNWNYRLWNNMPTDLERKNTKWKDDPYATE